MICTIVGERKKSKCDYLLAEAPTEAQMAEIENRVNEVIAQELLVSEALVSRDKVPDSIDMSKLPDNVSHTLRLVTVGDYDICACIGQHVKNTNEIGKFKITSADFAEGRLRIRFKLQDCPFVGD